MRASSNIVIAILAAGASSRMGSPKQLLKWGEVSLLQHTIKTCNATSAKEIVVVLGAHQDVVFSEIKDESVDVIINKDWQLGLGKSIAYAAQHCLDSKEKIDGLLVVLADQPFVTSSFLNQLIINFDVARESILATKYIEDKKGVPVLFHKSYFKELSQISGDDGAKSILKKYNNLVKTVIPDFDNMDIDTQEDYQNLDKPL